MIDIRTEKVVTLSQAAALLPDRPATATLWRWRTKGVGGRRLESFSAGGKVYTSVEALQRFTHQQGGEPTLTQTPRQRRVAIEAAEKELRAAGI